MSMYAIKKDGRFVKDFSEGAEFTGSFKWIEKYRTYKSALLAAQSYGKVHGKGYHVVELW